MADEFEPDEFEPDGAEADDPGPDERGRGEARPVPAAPPVVRPGSVQPDSPPASPLPESFPDRFAPVESGPSAPVIISRIAARLAPADAAMPGRALVFSYRDGTAVHLSAPPRARLGGFGGPAYEWRFEVDTTLRSDTFVASVPSRTDLARFVVTVQAEWSVTDPVRVVKRGLADGARLVRTRLLDAARSVGHGYRIEQISELETALAARLGGGPQEYDEGVTVHRCYVTADPDDRSRAKLERLDEARVRRQLSDEEVSALRSSVRSSSDLFLHYLAQDRHRVGELIADMRRHEEIKEERVIDLFRQAVDSNIMHPAEINEMLGRLLGPITGVFQPGGRTDLFGTHEPEAAPPAERPAIPVQAEPEDGDDEDGDDEDIMPEDLRKRAEDGVEGWRPMPWDS
ncbi:hypothetical protein [Actinomadura sp. 7K507]|uniref:hypothetical protein n=1 Tax=Actinomadura sp. 7K507 TaxID=2530365 RepID=UPI001045D4C8|nr:hypothetical protein [Actinomadura sp. 7K507]TDC82164.1 hypothetical protein E1285_31235 [Actinomadura sp. 7K507]